MPGRSIAPVAVLMKGRNQSASAQIGVKVRYDPRLHAARRDRVAAGSEELKASALAVALTLAVFVIGVEQAET